MKITHIETFPSRCHSNCTAPAIKGGRGYPHDFALSHERQGLTPMKASTALAKSLLRRAGAVKTPSRLRHFIKKGAKSRTQW